jgi:hypothetical protein
MRSCGNAAIKGWSCPNFWAVNVESLSHLADRLLVLALLLQHVAEVHGGFYNSKFTMELSDLPPFQEFIYIFREGARGGSRLVAAAPPCTPDNRPARGGGAGLGGLA